MKKLILLLAILLSSAFAAAQSGTGGGGTGTGGGQGIAVLVVSRTIASLPAAASSNNGAFIPVKDGLNGADCTAGGGTTPVLCQSNGVAWVAAGGGSGSSSNGQCLYNNNGGIGGIVHCTTDGTNVTALTVTGTLTSTLGTVTSNTPTLSGTETWNNGASNLFGVDLSYIVTAAGSGSRFFRFRGGAAGTTTEADLDTSGNMTLGGSLTTGSSGGVAGTITCPEGTAPSGSASNDLAYCDSTAHRWKMINNNGTADTVVGAATTDTFTNKSMSEAQLTFTDITTGNVSTSNHGFVPKLDNVVTHFLNGQGGFTTPAGGGGCMLSAGNSAGVTLTVNQFGMVTGSMATTSATENFRRAGVGACTFTKGFITTSGAQAAADTVLTLNKNGSACGIVVTITANAAAGVFSDTAHSCTTVDGDKLDWAITGASTAAGIVIASVLQ